MKRILILTILLLAALLVLFVSCGGSDEPLYTTVQDTAPPLPDVDHSLSVTSSIDYAFVYGSFVRSSYNGAGNPTSRVYLDPTSMAAMPLAFYYTYRADGILSSLTIGEGANAIPLSVKYNSQGLPAEASATINGSVYSIRFTCDSKGRILAESFDFVSFTYNENGRLVKESGSSIQGSYQINMTLKDDLSMVSATYQGDEAFDLTITYNEKGYPISMTGVVNGAEPWQYTDGLVTWDYNDKDLCIKVEMKGDTDHTVLYYAYYENGTLATKTRVEYDQQGRLKSTKTYDDKGNLIQE